MGYKIFISHAYLHRRIYFELVQKLNDVGSRVLDWRNLSVQFDMRFGPPSAVAALVADRDDEWLRQEISKRIEECDVFLTLTKPVASRRRWLQWEIVLAKRLDKPIVGIARKRNDQVSKFVRVHADDIVDTWRVEHIVNAIKNYGHDYRARRAFDTKPSPPPLPRLASDKSLAPEPSPRSPEEVAEAEGRFSFLKRILPKDLLFRDAKELKGGPAFPMPPTGDGAPRWWSAKNTE